MEQIIIIGNSGAARECHQLFMDSSWSSPTLRTNSAFKGFLSFKNYPGHLGELSNLFLGDFDDYEIAPEDRFIIGIGSPRLRKSVYLAVKERNGKLFNLVSPWSYIPGDCTIGEGNIINSNCNFSGADHIGNGNYFNGNVRLGHDVSIGDFNFFGPSTTVLGGATVGSENTVAVHSVLLEGSRMGNNNHIHPASVLFKGCKNNCRMAGNPAQKIASIEE